MGAPTQTFLRRQPQMIALGLLSWLLAAWQLLPGDDRVGPYLALIAINGLGLTTAIAWLLRDFLRQGGLRVRDGDPVTWTCLLMVLLSAMTIGREMTDDAAEAFYLGFLIVTFSPLFSRFSPRLASFLIGVSSAGLAFAQPQVAPLPYLAYLLLQQAVLWRLGHGNITELRATQTLLVDSMANNERTRIARDLHDQMGHHLVALNLQLQLAGRQLGPDAEARLAPALTLVQALFADVRGTVQQLRHQEHAGFRQLVEDMLARIPLLRFRLEFDADLPLREDRQAECLLRVVQEGVTNALKHSAAREVCIRLTESDGNLCLAVQDDGGRPRGGLPEGGRQGLRGLRERLEALGGSLRADPTEAGFRLEARLPRGAWA